MISNPLGYATPQMDLSGARSRTWTRRAWPELRKIILLGSGVHRARVPQFLALLSLVGLVSQAPRVGAADRTSYWGKSVVEIHIESSATFRAQDFAEQITQKKGEPLDAAKVAESLKRLYATGHFRDLRADVEPRANGVALIFRGRAQFFVGVIRVEGMLGGEDPRTLTTAARLRLGQPLTEDELARAIERLKASFADNGYYRAQVRTRVISHPESQESDVIFSAAAGAPALLESVEISGQTVYPPARLAEVAGWRTGRHLTSARLEQGLYRIHQFYQKRQRTQAITALQKRVYNPEKNSEKLVVRADAGPLVRVRITGAHVSSSALRDLLPVLSEGVTDDFAVERGRVNLVEHFERKGYHSVVIQTEHKEKAQPPEVDVTYRVTLGSEGQFVGFAFEGNHALSEKELTPLLTLQPRSFFRDPGTFSRNMLAHDTQLLVSLYKTKGYLEARIAPDLNDHYQGVPDHLFVVFRINEGPITTVKEARINGVTGQMEKEILALLLSKPGQAFSPARVQTDRDAIFAYLNDRGYVQATVNWSETPASQPDTVNVEFQIQLGVRETVHDVVLMGYRHTRPAIIRRELQVAPDEALSQTAVVESQRRLYDLGVFNQVQIAPQDPETLPATGRTVLVNVEEARRWTLGYGGGIDVQRLGGNQPQGQYKSSPRVSLEANRLNVDGRAQTVTFRGRFSTLDKGASLTYTIPHLAARSNLNLRFYSLIDKSQDVLTFAAQRDEASMSLEKRYSPAALLVGRFSFRRVLVDASTLKISPEQIPLLSRPARVAMFSGSYINDHRDNPADATRGSYSLADAGISSDRYGSQANFLRVSAQNATYYRLGPHLIFARDTRFAEETPYGKAGTSITIIPLPERLFLGGSESHRGFSINQAGPRDPETGFPIGGKALFLNSFELRAPFDQGRLGLVLFHDAGNVYSTIRRMKLLKVTQNSPTDLDYTVHATGLGFRYKTPVGPLRFDLGYDLNPPRYQIASTRKLEPLGNISILEVRRLPRFQIFLGIGQTF